MAETSKFLWAAEHVLRYFGRPMRASEIYDVAREAGYIPDTFQGLTPAQTMKSKLSTHILKFGESSTFVRTSPGRFYLRELVEDNEQIYVAARWLPPASTEVVTVVPANFFRQHVGFQGITTDIDGLYDGLFKSGVCANMRRVDAEISEDFKQIITYVMVRRGDQFLAFRRGVFNQTADMLRGSDCIGFGGHVNAEDKTLLSSDDAGLLEATGRELAEELVLPVADLERLRAGVGLKMVGVLNDDSSGVGRRHFAVLFEYCVSDDPSWDRPTRGEESITQLRWVGGSESTLNLDEYEYWSQLCLRQFAPELVRMQPSFKVRRRAAFGTPHILCLVGQIGSGKTEAARNLAEAFGYAGVNTGHLVADLIGLAPVPETPREHFQEEALKFISSSTGPNRLAQAISNAADELNTDRVFVDGIRQVETLRCLRTVRRGERVPLVYLMAAPDIAYTFYRSRERATATLEEFLAVRDSPVEQEIRLMLRDADAVIYNWVGKAEFGDALAGVLRPG